MSPNRIACEFSEEWACGCAQVSRIFRVKLLSPLHARARVGLKLLSPLRAGAVIQLKPPSPLRGRNGRFGAFFGCRGVVGFNGYCSGASSGVWGFKFLVIAACRGGTGFICQLPELWDGSLAAPWCSGCRRARPSAKPAGPCCAVGGGSPPSRPRRELRSARRLVVRPDPAAARGHRSKAQAARGGLGLCTVSRR